MKKLLLILTLTIFTVIFAFVVPDAISENNSSESHYPSGLVHNHHLQITENFFPPDICGQLQIRPLFLNEDMTCGSAITCNSSDSLFVMVVLKEGILLNKLSIYKGDFDNFPLNTYGDPSVAEFPHQFDNILSSNCVRFALPLSENELDIIVSVYAEVVSSNPYGKKLTEGAWTSGINFGEGENTSSFFEYTVNNQVHTLPLIVAL